MEYLNREYGKRLQRASRADRDISSASASGAGGSKSARDFVGTYAYVVLNPVKAGGVSKSGGLALEQLRDDRRTHPTSAFVDATLVLAEVGGST